MVRLQQRARDISIHIKLNKFLSPLLLPVKVVGVFNSKNMDIIQQIRVQVQNIEVLKNLDCVRDMKTDGNNITVYLKDNKTLGNLIALTDEWLVEFKTGMWQRFGKEAYQQQIRCNEKHKI